MERSYLVLPPNPVDILFETVEAGQIEETVRLLDSADFDAKNVRGIDSRSLLEVSLETKNADMVNTLISRGCPSSCCWNG